jgi:hypothetical protein
MNLAEQGQAGAYEEYKGHGVCVPDGLQASWIMEGAWALEREFDVAPFTSRHMVSAVLQAILPLVGSNEISRSCHEGDEGESQLASSR